MEIILDYYITQGEKYFYEILKPLADTTNLVDADFIDWGNADNYVKLLSRRMCGVVIDLVATLLLEAKDKLTFQEAFEDKTGLMLFIMLMPVL
jgi:sulfite reductase (ferredoxin)